MRPDLATCPAPERLLDRLPPELREAVRAIGHDALNALGRPRKFQAIVDRHITTIDALADVTRTDISRLLFEVGVATSDGRPLPETTISSARARARSRIPAARRQADASGRATTRGDATERETTQHDAERRKSTPQDPSRRDATQPDAMGRAPTARAAAGPGPAAAARPPPDATSRTVADDIQTAANLLLELEART